MSQVVIYNAGGLEVLGRVSLKHALRMLHRKVAREKEWVAGETVGPYKKVTAVELVNYIFTKWMYEATGQVMFSKENLMRRDKHRCAFCTRRASTMDHIVPRCQGGRSEWLNCVAACKACNGRKAGRTPKQAGMRLLVEPFVPTMADLRLRRR